MYFGNSIFLVLVYLYTDLQRKHSSVVRVVLRMKAAGYLIGYWGHVDFLQSVKGGSFALRFFLKVRTDLL